MCALESPVMTKGPERQLKYLAEMRMLRFSQGMRRKDKNINEQVRVTLKVDKFGQKVRQ